MKQNRTLQALCSALLTTALACSSSPPPKVRVVAQDPIPPAAPAPAPTPAVQAAAPPPANPVPDGPLPELGSPLSTRELMEKAVEWATEGLRYYEQGHFDAARKSLNDAHILLLEADLPKFWEDQGLAPLQAGLPENLRHYDLNAVVKELERNDHLDAAERAERAAIESEVRRILRQFGDTTPEERYLDLLVEETRQYVSFYRGKYRQFFERSFLRKHKYWPTIQEVFAAQNLPVELGYLAFVESGFHPRAQSHANALGLWQFIPDTGRRYGLVQREDFFDTRKSTEAAADYLLDLLSIFGSRSFLLAAAAYNAGEGKILSCLRQIDNPIEKRTFWEIRGCLAAETREYIPRIMAAAVIGSDPARYGFELPGDEEIDRRYDVVVLPQVTSVARLASLSGLTPLELRQTNSDLDSSSSSTPGRNFPLYLPHGAGPAFLSTLAAAVPEEQPRQEEAELEAPREERRADKTYTVRRGDSLSSIARRHGVPLTRVASANRLRQPYHLRAGQRLVIPGGTAVASAGKSKGKKSGGDGDSGSSSIVFTVRSGNSLMAIADLFSVRYRDIMRWNQLRSSSLKAGQKLKIHPAKGFRTRTYQVKSGDSLKSIARRFGVTIDNLMTTNGLAGRESLRKGQRLVVYVPA